MGGGGGRVLWHKHCNLGYRYMPANFVNIMQICDVKGRYPISISHLKGISELNFYSPIVDAILFK